MKTCKYQPVPFHPHEIKKSRIVPFGSAHNDICMRLRNNIKLTLILLSGFVFAGCARNVSRNDAIGTYAITMPGATSVIELHSNGTYRHVYKNENNQDVIITDSWTFEIVEGISTVVLYNFESNMTGVNNIRGSGYRLFMAEFYNKGVRLWIDYERNIYFEKQNRPKG